MLNTKRAELGSFLTLFITTILVVILVLVFAIFSSFFISFTNTKVGVGVVSPLDSEVNKFMTNYKIGAMSVLNLETCGVGEAIALTGPYKGKCLCDSSYEGGYYHSKGHRLFTWFFPPCERSGVKGSATRPYDVSLEISEENKDDLGLCVYYISNRYYNDLSIGKELNIVGGEGFENIFEYDLNEIGYVDKVSKIPEVNGNFVVRRDSCAGINPKVRFLDPPIQTFRIFPVFYDYESAPLNIVSGFPYDLGYCFMFFRDGRIENPTGVGVTTREDCYSRYSDSKVKDRSVHGSFFVTEKSSGEEFNPDSISFKRKGEIMVQYFPDSMARVKGDDFSVDYIKENCERYEEYDVTFITGIIVYSSDGTPRLKSDGSIRVSSDSRIFKDCSMAISATKEEGFYYHSFYELVGKDDYKKLGEGNVCCYLTLKGEDN